MPQADNTPIDKVVLQFPGVSYDSAVSNPDFHVRSEYANVQYRINGIIIPEGVSGLGPVIDTNFIGSMSLLTGTLPAQYGSRTAGVLDIISRSVRRARRRDQSLWRQPADDHAQRRLWRQLRQLRILCHRARQLECAWNRKPDAQPRRLPRSNPARKVLRLFLDHAQ